MTVQCCQLIINQCNQRFCWRDWPISWFIADIIIQYLVDVVVTLIYSKLSGGVPECIHQLLDVLKCIIIIGICNVVLYIFVFMLIALVVPLWAMFHHLTGTGKGFQPTDRHITCVYYKLVNIIVLVGIPSPCWESALIVTVHMLFNHLI